MTKMGDTHGQWGLVPIWGMSIRLSERVSRSQAKELMFTSRRISGSAAADIGLIVEDFPGRSELVVRAPTLPVRQGRLGSRE